MTTDRSPRARSRSRSSTTDPVTVSRRPCRLVGEDHAWAGGEDAGDRDSLLLSAGERTGTLVRQLGDPDGRQRGLHFASTTRPRARRSGNVTFSRTVSAGIRLYDWNTKPTFSRRNRASLVGDRAPMSTPSMVMVPASAASSPERLYRSVDLPDPLGADDADHLARGESSDTPRMISVGRPAASGIPSGGLALQRCGVMGSSVVLLREMGGEIQRRREGCELGSVVAGSVATVGSGCGTTPVVVRC